KARVLPTIREYCAAFGKSPKALAWAMAAFIAFYRGTDMREGALVGRRGAEEYLIKDDADVLEFFRGLWAKRPVAGPEAEDSSALVRRILENPRLWDDDLCALPGFAEAVTRSYTAIAAGDVPGSMKETM
ncbi:MAG: hypothetical protein LBT68_00920, partial [Spirochaetales bacterium]|nr:hypothetical protein [Spirochaetales bacterium]